MPSSPTTTTTTTTPPPSPPPEKKPSPQWLLWALCSGAFAATNGVFAKLTTADHTHTLASYFSSSPILELLLRALFFGLNLLSNAIMWILFTRALTAATSTTRVSVLNVSANFLVTAVYGLVVFGEGVGVEWVVGAALLVAGSVVIGRREGAEVKEEGGEGAIRLEGEGDGLKDHEGGEGGSTEGESAVGDDTEEEEVRKEREVWDRED